MYLKVCVYMYKCISTFVTSMHVLIQVHLKIILACKGTQISLVNLRCLVASIGLQSTLLPNANQHHHLVDINIKFKEQIHSFCVVGVHDLHSPVQCDAFGLGTVDSIMLMTAGKRERVTPSTMKTETA